MSDTPLLSVVVPFYGVEDYLLECLQSLQAQTMSDLQVVLVDDGSPDNSIEIAEHVAAHDSRFQVVRQQNAGLGPARNTGQRHATGRYLTFVDSDDIVPHRAYEAMVASLERSGSSFAVGNARRFSRTSGVRQSWAHARPCAQDAVATHISERPTLAYDRMVWNKVYRREFYDEYGYAFPAIKYEDWPVTMRAHLEALTVDVLKTPTYYWRERESGDSITQQVFKYDNMLDRVISAEQVLDVLDAKATPSVRDMAHRHLREIDVIAIAQAFAVAEDDDVERLVDLSSRFVDRLTPPTKEEAPFNTLQFHAMKARDADLLRELARFRDDGGLVGGAHARRDRLKPWQWDLDFPGRGHRAMPNRLYEMSFTGLRLQTLVTGLQTDGDRITFDTTAQISNLSATSRDVVTVSLVNGIERIPLDVEVFETIDAFAERAPVGVRFEVDLSALRGRDDLVWPLRFEVTRTTRGVKRTAPLSGAGAGAPQYPQGAFLTPSQFVQPGLTSGNAYCLHRVAFPAVLTDVEVAERELTLHGTISEPARSAQIVVFRPNGSEVVVRAELSAGDDGGQRFTALVDLGDVLASDASDDPFLHTATRRIAIRTEFGDIDLTWPDYAGDAVALLSDAPHAEVPQRVALTRSRFGIASVVFGPRLPSVSSVQEHDGELHLSGPHMGLDVAGHLTWRVYLPDSDDHIDVPMPTAMDGDAWSGVVSSAALIPDADRPTRPGAPAADYTLFFQTDGYDTPVPIEPAALVQLPIERQVNGRTILATSLAGGARVQVR